jgi:diketogulonate reductase-like aldo/keto reductase
MSNIPQIALNDGNTIPQLGFGLWPVPDDEATPAVGSTIRSATKTGVPAGMNDQF